MKCLPRLLLAAVSLLVLAGICSLATACAPKACRKEGKILNPYERIRIVGETSYKGVYDPSLEYENDGRIGWLAYSALDAPAASSVTPNSKLIHTHLARTTDHGKSWQFVARLNTSTEAAVTLQQGSMTIQGAWWHEVPTLVHDPDDPGREWKLYWHKYFAIPKPYFEHPIPGVKDNLIRVWEYMWIAFKAAASPQELASAKEEALFDAGKSELASNRARIDLTTIPALRDARAFSEPGSLYRDGVLYVCLSKIPMEKVEDHSVVLLASSDHGRSWKYVGTLLDHQDATHLDPKYQMLTGTSLAQDKGRVFLLAAAFHRKRHHDGTYIFEFDDIAKAKLKRDPSGRLNLHARLDRRLPGDLNSGQSDYDEHNFGGGVIMPQADLAAAPAFGQIFNTRRMLVP